MAFREVPILTPTPNPRIPYQGFLSAARSRMEILSQESLVGAKTAPTAVSRTSAPLLRRVRFPPRLYFSQPESDEKKTSDVGVIS